MILINELDLEKSFNKLKKSLAESESSLAINELAGKRDFGYMQSYLNLNLAVQRHLKDCIGGEPVNIPAANPDDIKDVNI